MSLFASDRDGAAPLPWEAEAAAWMLARSDRFDWGWWDHRRRRPDQYTNDKLEQWVRRQAWPRPQRLDETLVAFHLLGRDVLYVHGDRRSGAVLLRLDVDAHHGEPDAPAAAAFLAGDIFPGAYSEGSPRGHSVYLPVDVRRCRRAVFNRMAADLGRALALLVARARFASAVEVCGGFTLFREGAVFERPRMARLPMLAHGPGDWARLRAAPLVPIPLIQSVTRSAGLTNVRGKVVSVAAPSPNAFERMNAACFEFTRFYRRLPSDVGELVEHYTRVYAGVATVDGETFRRAAWALQRAAERFDPSKAVEGGFETYRGQLFDAVRTYCTDRRAKCETAVTDEDLAVGLYVVTRNAFCVQSDPRRQWTCPHNAFSAMFKALKAAGLIRRAAGSRNKAVAVKQILERAGLIECIDRRWLHAGKTRGVGKKFIAGPNHWRRAEWLAFSQGLEVEFTASNPTTDHPSTAAPAPRHHPTPTYQAALEVYVTKMGHEA